MNATTTTTTTDCAGCGAECPLARYRAKGPDGAPKTRKSDVNPGQAEALEAARAGDWSAWDRVVVAFSGGKDSLAVAQWALEHGCPRSKLVLWHHDIDGREGSALFDWPSTPDYCRAAAEALELPIRYSWRVGGFEREMLRENVPTAACKWESDADADVVQSAGGKGPAGTRMRFPAISADLTCRWCSAYLKIDVARRALANDPAFASGRFLLLSGERRQESAARGKYAEAEVTAATKARLVVQWRPVIDLDEAEVWALVERAGVQPHPAYELGFGRLSCAFCIFGQARQFRTAADLLPDQFERLAALEDRFVAYWAQTGFGGTLKRKGTLRELVTQGTPYEASSEPRWRALAIRWTGPAKREGPWRLPAGAFGDNVGPS